VQILTLLRMAPWVAILLLLLALGVVDRRADKWEAQSLKLSAELKRISTEKNEQRTETDENIAEAEKGRKGAETIAKRIEAAPLPGQCATPREILSADL
jgi:biopolymer transport protein ExbB/TolQ